MTQPNLVLLRHGESIWNKKGIFTGWVDIGLSKRGEEEAIRAGELLKRHGYNFDHAYTSVLKRAIKTLWLTLEAMDEMAIPVNNSWRLNERHYGALQRKSKKAIAAQFGQEQFLKWRRSFSERPPVARAENLIDQINIKELPARLRPKTESLQDTYRRVLPYWRSDILPALRRGEKVLIVAHGNSLRALVKYLENISSHDISELEIPTGHPLCYKISPTGVVKKKWKLNR